MPTPGADRLARLALPDGMVFRGRAFGDTATPRTIAAEVVFNTAMAGYQEALTDPSYSGQILVMTTPLIGNSGANNEDLESAKAQVSGFVVRELARRESNQRSTQSLSAWLASQGVVAMQGVDTRAITQRLRSSGVTPAILTTDESIPDAELVRLAKAAPVMDGQNLVPLVACASAQRWHETLGEWAPPDARPSGEPLRVLALDCGAKRNILRNLAQRGCEVRVVPFDTPAFEIRAMHDRREVDGLFVSNGPGDPAAVTATIDTLRALVAPPVSADKVIPTFGICLGHQMLSLAIGAKTVKLKFGHRGANQPVRNLLTGRVEITSQNHGFAVDAASLERVGGEATHINLNDGTLAGFRMADRPVFAVQHHPEASPGPHDAGYLFDAFVSMMRSRRPVDCGAMGGPPRPEVVVGRKAATPSGV